MIVRRRRFLAPLIGMALIVGSLAAVYAETASLTLNGGSLSITPSDVTLGAMTLNGQNQASPLTALGAHSWTVVDARGTGAGWHVTIESTDFTDGTTPTPQLIDISNPSALFEMQLTQITDGAGSTGSPSSSAPTLTPIPEVGGTPLTFVSAASGDGRGSFTLDPQFQLNVVAGQLLGTGTYTATITITVISGP